MAESLRDRRLEPRLLCADLIQVEWNDASGRTLTAWANLEDISATGVGLQIERCVPVGTAVRISCNKTAFDGRIRYCEYRATGYFLGVEFEPGTHWNRRAFRPKHLLDPRRLVRMTSRRVTDGSIVQ